VNPGGVAVVEGPEGVISYANAAFRGILGTEKTPLLGRRAGRAFQTRLGRHLLQGVEEVRAGSRVYDDPRLKVSDQYGSRFYELHLESERGMEDDATYILIHDHTDMVTMRSALEQTVLELADSQSLLSAVLDSTDNGIVLVGTDGSILFANERLSGMFDFDVRAVIGESQTILVEHMKGLVKDSDRFIRSQLYLQDHLEDKVSDQIEMVRPTHRVLDRYSGPVYKPDGTLFGRIEVYTDVTEVHQLQRNKDEFLAVVSHELKTPVTSIKGYAQLLGRRAVREHLQASTISSLGVIERQANRMQQLIESLLDLSRWDLGKLKFEPQQINMSELVRHTADLAGMTSESRSIDLRLPTLPVWIRGDEQRMEQVVTNLLLNAIRYSPGGETITVSLQEDDDVRLIVRDRGIGIPPEARLRIFERFYRGPGMTSLTGLGIGLYISKNIVEQHGGRITVESEVGAGSTFVVTLPRLREPATEGQSSD
jgi:signal transduction histidine kinase